MAYSKQNFRDGDVLYASSLNSMDDQIAANETAASEAKDAASNGPKIQNDIWYLYNPATKQYVSTGVKAVGTDGHSPVITTSKSGKVTTIYADGVAIGTVRDGEDGSGGGGSGTITGVSVNGTSVATSGVANITTVAVAQGSNGIPSAGAVYTAINEAVGDVESALAAL